MSESWRMVHCCRDESDRCLFFLEAWFGFEVQAIHLFGRENPTAASHSLCCAFSGGYIPFPRVRAGGHRASSIRTWLLSGTPNLYLSGTLRTAGVVVPAPITFHYRDYLVGRVCYILPLGLDPFTY